MKAGRELDALVAEKVMGCKLVWPPRFDEPGISQSEYERRRRLSRVPRCGCADREHMFIPDESGYSGWLMDYSTDISAAWDVVEKLGKDDFQLTYTRSNGWAAGFGDVLWSESAADWTEDGPPLTPMRAICLAALKAVGVNTDYCSG